jgi:assimilatory nitrate reductase catalytic subunit
VPRSWWSTARTATAEDADLFLAIAPGMDGIVLRLLVHLADTHALDYQYVSTHDRLRNHAGPRARDCPDLATAAQVTGLQPSDLMRFFDLFRRTRAPSLAFPKA